MTPIRQIPHSSLSEIRRCLDDNKAPPDQELRASGRELYGKAVSIGKSQRSRIGHRQSALQLVRKAAEDEFGECLTARAFTQAIASEQRVRNSGITAADVRVLSNRLCAASAICKALDPHGVDRLRAEEITDQLLQCLDGNQLKPDRRYLAAFLGLPGMCAALQAYAAADGGSGITSVILPDFGEGGRSQIDLTGLEKLETVTVEGRPREVRVRLGVIVSAAPSRSREKTAVKYCKDGKEEAHSALNGAIYYHRGKNPAVNVNCRSTFPDENKLYDPRIACRHIGMTWIEDRHRHLQDKKDGKNKEDKARSVEGGSDDFYAPYATEGGIRAHVEPACDLAFSDLEAAGAESHFEIGHFGDVLADQFDGNGEKAIVKMAPGEARQFFIHSGNHVLALELQVKQKPHGTEYVVNFYDPNDTATHLRSMVFSPGQLRGRSLAEWVTQERLSDYFVLDGPRFGALYQRRWPSEAPPAPAGQAAGRRDRFHYVPIDHRKASGAFLYWLVSEGSPKQVEDCIDGLLAQAREKGKPIAAYFEFRVGAALHRAMRLGRADAVEACVKKILAIGDEDLPAAEKRVLLGEGVEFDEYSPLERAFMAGRAGTVRTFMELIVDSKALEAQDKVAILSGPVASGSGCQPLLHTFASTGKVHGLDPQIRRRRDEAIYCATQAIVQAKALALPDKLLLCQSMHGGSTAAQVALRVGHPGAAGAMVCAVLEMEGTPDERQALLEALGSIDVRKLLGMLIEKGQREPWLERIMRSIDRCGLPRSEIDALREEFGAPVATPEPRRARTDAKDSKQPAPVVPVPVLAGSSEPASSSSVAPSSGPTPLSAQAAARLLLGKTVVPKAAGEELRGRCRSAGLKAYAFEVAAGGEVELLCSAAHPIAGLEGSRAEPPENKAAEPGRHHYRIPGEQLELCPAVVS